MPAPGDQHKPTTHDHTNHTQAANVNPFEEPPHHISAYTAAEVATLQARLNKRLGPEFISTRAGPGGAKVAYLQAEKVINLANEVFGFNGWSSSIQNIHTDFIDENPVKGTYNIGLSVVIRITLRDGTYHEDIGYGSIDNAKSKALAYEKAKKEGTTDALKRALRTFGNILGNCVYDKDYIAKISKVKAGSARWDIEDLHRHEDFQPKKEEQVMAKQEPMRQPPGMNGQNRQQQEQGDMTTLVAEDSFDVEGFDENDFDDFQTSEDAMLLATDTRPGQQARPSGSGGVQNYHNQTPSKPPIQRQGPGTGSVANNANNIRHAQFIDTNQPQSLKPQTNASNDLAPQNKVPSRSSSPGAASQHAAPAPQTAPHGPAVVGFFSARVADSLDENNNPTDTKAARRFDPSLEAQSIRKTPGVDHSKSLALNKNTLKPEPIPSAMEENQSGLSGAKASGNSFTTAGPATRTPARPNMPARMSTSAYRPPMKHGGAPGVGIANGNSPAGPPGNDRIPAKRAPLSDLSNVQNGLGNVTHAGAGAQQRHDGEPDTKRQRIGPGLSGNAEGLANLQPPAV